MKLWVDDERPAPSGWTHAHNYREATGYLYTGKVDTISLDHDLGEDKSGYDIAKFLVEQRIWPRIIYIHTMNPVGRDNIKQLLTRYAPSYVRIS
jgi:hypothetical protein